MLVAVCSDKGSPGATTSALALAAAWPGEAQLVEADPYGGDLAIRLRTSTGEVVPPTPTVLTLAAAAGVGADAYLVGAHARRFTPHMSVLPGHLVAEKASGIAQSWEPLAKALSVSATDVVADLGRIHSSAPSVAVAAAADVVVVIARADAGSLLHLRERLTGLIPTLADRAGRPPVVWVLLVTRARYGEADVADCNSVLAASSAGPMIAGIGYLAHDPATVERLEHAALPTGRLGRTPLLRSARHVAAQIRHTWNDAHNAPAPADSAPAGDRR